MKVKTQLISTCMLFVALVAMMIVGVWAVSNTNFKVSGNITFNATGIHATISKGTLNDASSWVTSSDADIKMQEVVINTSKTQAEIQEEFKSWEGLNLVFNDAGDDVKIAFTITNTSTREEYISVNVNVSGGTMTNSTVSVSPTNIILAPGDVKEFVITFTVQDTKFDASLSGFEIDFDLQMADIPDASTFTTLSFTYDTTAKTASVRANSNNKPTGDLEIPRFVKYNDVVYAITSIPIGARYSNGAFYGCSGLISVSIPDGVTIIGDYAFYSCSGLTKILISEGVQSIGDRAFYGCTGITNIEIPASVTSIGESAFRVCTGLTSIKIPEGVTSIADYAFYQCTGLTSIKIPEGVTSIGDNTFNGCSELESVNIPEGVKSIGPYAFEACKKITSITLPSTLTNIKYNAFANTGLIGELNIPASVTSLGNDAFYQCTGLTKILISEGVQSIGNRAFWGCTGITNIEIPASVTSIGEAPFVNCNISSIVVNEDNATYDSRENCNAIIETSSNTLIQGCNNSNIPSSVTSIGNYAFRDCSKLTAIVLPTGLTSIGNHAFEYCSSLTGELTIPEKVTSIGSNAFYNCSKLTSITIPEGIEKIYSSTFNRCYGLISISLPNTLTSINSYAFSGCSKLSSITIPAGVTSIGSYAFRYCTALEYVNYLGDINNWVSIAFGDNTSSPARIGSLKINGETVTNAIIDTATSINSYAFYSCENLVSVKIGDIVTSIGQDSFSGCSALATIIIDSSIIAGDLSGTGTSVCGGLIASATTIYVKTDIISSLNSYVTTNYTNVETITSGEYAGYTCYSK